MVTNAQFAPAPMDLRLAEEVLYDLPPLEGVFSPWENRPLHARLLWHDPSHSVAETQARLSSGVLVQKTVAIRLGERLLLCTGLGTESLTRWQLRDVTGALSLSYRTLKRCTITSSAHASLEALAMQPEVLSPFLPPERGRHLSALVLLPWPRRLEAQEREVAISLSLWESLALPVCCLPPLLRRHGRLAYLQVRLIELSNAGAIESCSAGDDGS